METPANVPAVEGLARLREGNRRFAAGEGRLAAQLSRKRLADLRAGQRPFAVVVGCSDSRVPVEIVFDQPLGDLFVVRVAGQIAALSQLGSVEFAVDRLGAGLVVVLGHESCGAVAAAVQEAIDGAPTPGEGPLGTILARIRPVVTRLLDRRPELRGDAVALAHEAVRANVWASVQTITEGSPAIGEALAAGRLAVVGAVFSLADGVVRFVEKDPTE